MGDKEARGCFLLSVLVAFVVAASLAIGLYVGAWAGFAVLAAALLVYFAASVACKVMGHDGIKGVNDIHIAEPKVLDADGVPIRVGDTVYYVDGREQRVNTAASVAAFKREKKEGGQE